jgi:glutathione S-transferase
MLKIWGRLNSINVQKVVWIADECGIAYERVDAGGVFGIVDTDEYREMNPNGLVPAINDDGFILWESNAIVRYLADRYGGALSPHNPQQRADADRWMDWQAVSFNPALGPAFVQLIRTPPAERDIGLVEQSRSAVEKKMALLDRHLATRPYLAGDQFTMGDIPLGASVHRWLHLPLPREPHAHVERWYRELAARPRAQQVMTLALS